MAVPKRKTSKARKGWRCTHQVEKVTSFTHCLNCKNPLATHQVCKSCGYYKGVKVLNTKLERAMRREDQRKARAEQQNVANQEAANNEQVLQAQAEEIAEKVKKEAVAKAEETKATKKDSKDS